MTSDKNRYEHLIQKLSRGVSIAAPVMIAVAGIAAAHAVVSDAFNADSGYYMAAAEAEAEAEASAEGEAEPEAEAEAEAEADPEAEAEAEAD